MYTGFDGFCATNSFSDETLNRNYVKEADGSKEGLPVFVFHPLRSFTDILV